MDCQKGFFAKSILLFMMFLTPLLSCAKTTVVTEDEILRGDYRKGMVIKARKDILIDYKNYLWAHIPDIERVKEHGFNDDFKGFITKGTELKISRVDLYQHIENGNYIYPMAVVLNGPWKGEEVNLHYTSKSSTSPYNDTYYIDILDVDPELFEIVKN